MANETRESLTSDDVKAGAVETGLNHNIQGKLSAFIVSANVLQCLTNLLRRAETRSGI